MTAIISPTQAHRDIARARRRLVKELSLNDAIAEVMWGLTMWPISRLVNYRLEVEKIKQWSEVVQGDMPGK